MVVQSRSVLRVGLVIADEMEFKPFVEWSRGQSERREDQLFGYESLSFSLQKQERKLQVEAVLCGIGKVNAATAAAFLAAKGMDIMLNIGLSGGISNVRRGDLVAGTQYLEADFDLTPLGYQLGEKPGQTFRYSADPRLLEAAKRAYPGLKSGILGCGDFFLSDPGKKSLYYEAFDLSAFDMETGAIGSVCCRAGIPYLSIRKISDDAAEQSVDEYTEMNNLAESSLVDVLRDLLDQVVAEDSFWN